MTKKELSTSNIFIDSCGNPAFVNDHETVVAYLLRFLFVKKMSIIELAVRAGVDAGTISRILNRKTQPQLITLIRIAHVVGLSRDGCLRFIGQYLATTFPEEF